jgi:hypothetical protein
MPKRTFEPNNLDQPSELSLEERLEAAANLISSQLSPAVRSFFNEVADKVLGIKRWELMAGSVLAQYSQGTLVSPELDPAWKEPTEVDKPKLCPHCGKEFYPTRTNQLYCSTSCGSEVRKLLLAKKLEEDRQKVRDKMVKYISTKIDEAEKSGVKANKLFVARNVYNTIRDVLTNQTFSNLRVVVLEDAPDDKIVIAQ